jgi:hypothetical protein
MKKKILLLTLLTSLSSFASCFEQVSKRHKSINIYSTIDYSGCTESELMDGKSNLERFLADRVRLLKKEINKKNSGVEQFRLITEINAGKVSITMMDQVLRDKSYNTTIYYN